MANWHVRAVMERRKEYESEEYTKDYDIVMAIAVHIGEDDSPAVMSIAAIARYAGCHYNTVDKRTKVLAAEGKLAIGPGHGKMLAYNLPFESKRALSDERPPAPAAEQDETKSLREEVRQLREVVAELSESVKHLHTAITTSSHSHHTDVTSHQSDYVKKVEKKKRSKESPLPPLNGTAIDRRIKVSRGIIRQRILKLFFTQHVNIIVFCLERDNPPDVFGNKKCHQTAVKNVATYE